MSFSKALQRRRSVQRPLQLLFFSFLFCFNIITPGCLALASAATSVVSPLFYLLFIYLFFKEFILLFFYGPEEIFLQLTTYQLNRLSICIVRYDYKDGRLRVIWIGFLLFKVSLPLNPIILGRELFHLRFTKWTFECWRG